LLNLQQTKESQPSSIALRLFSSIERCPTYVVGNKPLPLVPHSKKLVDAAFMLQAVQKANFKNRRSMPRLVWKETTVNPIKKFFVTQKT